MRILFINNFAPSFPGSFFECLLALSKELAKNGNNLYYVFPLERDYIRKLEEYGTIYYCPSFMGKKFDFTLIKLVYRICKKEKIDIIHTNFGLAGVLTANLLSRITKIKHIAHERSLAASFDMKDKNIKYVLKHWKAGIFFRMLNIFGKTKYIAISSGVKKSLENYNKVNSKNICIIPNAVLARRSKQIFDEDHFRNIRDIVSNKPVVGMIAHLGPQKDHKTLIDAGEIVIKKIPDVIFLLIGGNLVTDKMNFCEKISSYIKEKKLEKKLVFVGEVVNPMPYIELFDIGCLISNREGFGNALVEYMLKKKPVIGTAVGGIKDIIDDGANGFLIPPKRADILAEKIIYLIENPQIAKEMGEKGYRKAVREYNMDKWVKSIIDVYKSLK